MADGAHPAPVYELGPGQDPIFQIGPYRSPRRLSRTLLILLGMGLGIDLIAVASGLAERSLLEGAQRGDIVSFDEAESNDQRQMAVGLIQTGLFLIAIPVFIAWFRRVYRNLPSLGARHLRFKPGWAVGAWFVPFLNLFRPVYMTYDIWKASDPEMDEAPDTPWRAQRGSALIGFWWASWMVANFAANAAFRRSWNTIDLESLHATSSAWVIADALSVVATVFAITLVWQMTSRQEQRAQKLAAAGALTGLP